VLVKCIGIDEKSGKIKLSRKALIPKPEGADAEPEGDAPAHDDRPRRPRPPRRDR
jgi:polyribonucleotide nucleotidyltransferase